MQENRCNTPSPIEIILVQSTDENCIILSSITPLVLRNIFFETGKNEILPNSYLELDRLVRSNASPRAL